MGSCRPGANARAYRPGRKGTSSDENPEHSGVGRGRSIAVLVVVVVEVVLGFIDYGVELLMVPAPRVITGPNTRDPNPNPTKTTTSTTTAMLWILSELVPFRPGR